MLDALTTAPSLSFTQEKRARPRLMRRVIPQLARASQRATEKRHGSKNALISRTIQRDGATHILS